MTISLKDFRNWLAGDSVHGLPHRKLPTPEQPPGPGRLKAKAKKIKKGQGKSSKRFFLRTVLGADGKVDVELGFGRHRGARVSDLVTTADGRSYISWMQTQDFEEEMMTPVNAILADYHTRSSKPSRRK